MRTQVTKDMTDEQMIEAVKNTVPNIITDTRPMPVKDGWIYPKDLGSSRRSQWITKRLHALADAGKLERHLSTGFPMFRAAEIDLRAATPGSDYAVDNGCLCPVRDNSRGRGYKGIEDQYVINPQCPLHGGILETDTGE